MRKMNMKHCLRLSLLLIFLLGSTHVAANPNNPFAVTDYGNFTQMFVLGKAPAHVALQPLQGRQHLYGLGALESLQGEITLIDGHLLISRGVDNDAKATQVTSHDNATLLVTAFVKDWIAVSIPSDLDQAAFEKFIVEAASKSGIPSDLPFPFLVKGEIKNLQWHVINSFSKAKKNSIFQANKKYFQAERVSGTLIGFYTGQRLAGIISHTGKQFHLHFADSNLTHAGHVDEYGVSAHATLFLPKQ